MDRLFLIVYITLHPPHGLMVIAVCSVRVCCVRLRKARALESRERQITYKQNRQAQVHIRHHYHQGLHLF